MQRNVHLIDLVSTPSSQACEPKCTDAYKAYLACVDRIEAKGGGTILRPRAPNERLTRRVGPERYAALARLRGAERRSRARARRLRADRIRSRRVRRRFCAGLDVRRFLGDCEPFYFDWLKCIDKCAIPHIMGKLK